MLEFFLELFSYTFITRAMLVGTLVSLCAAILGVSLVLKRYSMIGQGLSNVGFAALTIATAIGLSPLQVSLPIVVIAAYFLLRIKEDSKVQGDAAIGLISSSALAIGIIVTSLTTGINTDVCNYLFGSVLAMSKQDVYLGVVLSIVVLITYVLCYDQIFAVTFDENFSKATGVKVERYNILLAVLTAVTIVIGMRLMGVMLISSLIILPALTAMKVFNRFKLVIIAAGIIAVVCFFIGLSLSFAIAIPVGASITMVNLVAFGIASIIAVIAKIG